MPTVFAIAAHPDDIEFLMAGTLMRLKDVGFDLHYMNLANGCCGTTEYNKQTIIKMRREEAMASANLIGATYHESICDDLAIFYDASTLAKLASTIRNVSPDIVLTHSPQDYMEDHTNACRLAVTATFARGMPNFDVDPPRNAVSKKVTIYHAQPYSHFDALRQPVDPDFYVDVTDLVERKVEMLAQHASQKKWLDESQGQDSYLQTLRELDSVCGRRCGVFPFAEGWRRHLHLGFCEKSDDPIVEVLAPKYICAEQNPESQK